MAVKQAREARKLAIGGVKYDIFGFPDCVLYFVQFDCPFSEQISFEAELFKLVAYGPILVVIAILGIFGNILSIIIFTRSSMKKSAINFIFIGKHI